MALSKDLDIKFQTAVREIISNCPKGVEVVVTDATNPDSIESERLKGKLDLFSIEFSIPKLNFIEIRHETKLLD